MNKDIKELDLRGAGVIQFRTANVTHKKDSGFVAWFRDHKAFMIFILCLCGTIVLHRASVFYQTRVTLLDASNLHETGYCVGTPARVLVEFNRFRILEITQEKSDVLIETEVGAFNFEMCQKDSLIKKDMVLLYHIPTGEYLPPTLITYPIVTNRESLEPGEFLIETEEEYYFPGGEGYHLQRSGYVMVSEVCKLLFILSCIAVVYSFAFWVYTSEAEWY